MVERRMITSVLLTSKLRSSTRIISGATTALLGVILVFFGCAPANPTFEIRSGIVEKTLKDETPWTHLVEETNVVSRNLGPNLSFGFVISSSDKEAEFEVYSISYLPAPPKKLGEGFSDYEPKDAVSGIKGETRLVIGHRYFLYKIDPDDPLGEYRIEVYINDTLEREIRFSVIE